MAKGIGKRQLNGSAFFPQWIWNHIDVNEGEEIEFEDHKGTKGKSIRFWKKGD